jgi:arginase family enzyme
MSRVVAKTVERLPAAGFLSRLKTMPARTASFAGHPGPVALYGAQYGTAEASDSAAHIALQAFQQHGMASGTDFYGEVEWHADLTKAVEKPPSSTTFMPTIDCGVLQLTGDGRESNDAMRATTSLLTEKGIVPVCVSERRDAIVPMIEGIRQITGEEFFILHLGANTWMDTEDAPLTQVLRKGLGKNCLSIGNRGVSKFARQVRRQHEVRYVDHMALFHKGTFTVKDIRNQYPCFIAIDADVLDPAVAPGVARPEPGGMTLREMLHVLSVLRGTRVMGALITGFDPEYDILRGAHRNDGAHQAPRWDGLTAMAMAKMTKEVLTKVYGISVLTAAEGHNAVEQLIAQGKVPSQYPD